MIRTVIEMIMLGGLEIYLHDRLSKAKSEYKPLLVIAMIVVFGMILCL